jgi:hypothetical protein
MQIVFTRFKKNDGSWMIGLILKFEISLNDFSSKSFDFLLFEF